MLTEPKQAAPACCDALRTDTVLVDQSTVEAWDAAHGQVTDGRVKQFRGDLNVLVGMTQLVPRLPTTGVFLAARQSG